MLFFIDESGYNDDVTPYKVLASISIKENFLWSFLLDYADLKKKILGWSDDKINNPKFEIHAHEFLSKSKFKPKNKKIGDLHCEFILKTIDLLTGYDCCVFAMIVRKDAPSQANDSFLSKDYSFLFERFAEFIRYKRNEENGDPYEIGIIIHDSKDINFSRRLINQMREYYSSTGKGRRRAEYICPFPFFADSNITPFIEIVDLCAYCLNWGYRAGRINAETRTELEKLAKEFAALRFKIPVLKAGEYIDLYSIHFIDDLRPKSERF